ncbi:MAG: helix-turn-helix transcriptional regulator [Oceanospirillaceae bacterium]|nr:helix-turn-helix transcriptional regulator [Oceanospirillaceae bacterium]
MDEYINEKQLTKILKATSDVTRRSLLTSLVQEGPLRVTELAAQYDMSLNAISKHIKVLESAKLVSRTTLGRVHLIKAELAPIQQIDNWFKSLRSIWDLRLDNLEHILKKEFNDE